MHWQEKLIYPVTKLIIIEIKKPIGPITIIPIAETLATWINSSLEGFLRTIQTLLHFSIKDFSEFSSFII